LANRPDFRARSSIGNVDQKGQVLPSKEFQGWIQSFLTYVDDVSETSQTAQLLSSTPVGVPPELATVGPVATPQATNLAVMPVSNY
jgi:hypothetical protein